ncbi:hypothetical protein FCM35_KLT09797 [Carex littledalei]|uniref:Uncharacterized protein n=1 Tax=Carex littledalei TaxID=544730 RepID=A0A833RJC8_9POAL|nr:hypothetical protein FCM35_KLT09797 [Carex littledalei]
MLTFLQTPVISPSHELSKTLNPHSTYPLIFSFPLTTIISTKHVCQPKTSFPTLATSSSSQSHPTAGPNPYSKSLKSIRNTKKKTKSVTSVDDKVMNLSGGNNGNDTILENDQSDLSKQATNTSEPIQYIKPQKLQQDRRSEAQNDQSDLNKQAPNPSEPIEYIKPRKPQRGRRSEAQATEDFIRNQLEQTLASIAAKNPNQREKISKILKERPEDPNSDSDEESEVKEGEKKGLVEEEDPEWPLDAEVGWGVRASDYFEKHPIKNVVENGVEIDWEGELDEGWVQEINCLEWESFAYHPSPLVVLVFERYTRAADNWKFLKELEKAAKVYWSCKDRLPPRTVKIDVNIERDLAYALKVTESDCPQLLFLKGNRILYREKEIRCSDELVRMIAHFYYNAKRPEWVDSSAVASS